MAAFTGFEWQGEAIVNPTVSPCGRFTVSPEQYGFTLQHIGGRGLAMRVELPHGGYILLTDESGCSADLGEFGDTFVLGVYTKADECEGTTYEMRVGIHEYGAYPQPIGTR